MAHCTQNCVMNVINLGNSIIGVSILAMPYCFRKCGILLSILLIIISGFLVRSACYLLLKAAIMARRRNFEFLAFHTFGSSGKFFVEMGIIGFLIGVCIAFFVVIGDVGPALVAECFLIKDTPKLRFEVLVFMGLFVALPLGLLRKVDSLTSCSALSIAFYGFLVIKIISEALPKLMLNEWWYEVNWWEPSGLLPCLPIFSMALSCQTQLFEFFDTLSDPSLKRMTTVVSGAVHLCSAVYILVGVFGYVAFHDEVITGNILVRLTPSVMTEFIKLGFIITVAISFPLCLFPCRTSLHSLLFKQGVSHHDMGVNFIPDRHFRLLTISLVSVTIGIAIMLPNIEFVLGIIGSTIGTTVCLILPAVIFIHATTKNSSEKLRAQFVMLVGVFILVACTYSTLQESKGTPAQLPENTHAVRSVTEKPFTSVAAIASVAPLLKNAEKKNVGQPAGVLNELRKTKVKEVTGRENKSDIDQKRQEPPVPQEPELKSLKVEPNVDLDPQALQKEDKELQKDVVKTSPGPIVSSSKNGLDKHEQLFRKLEAHQKEQKKLLEEQKKLLEELKQHKESHNEINAVKPGNLQDIKISPRQHVKPPLDNNIVPLQDSKVEEKKNEQKGTWNDVKQEAVNHNLNTDSDRQDLKNRPSSFPVVLPKVNAANKQYSLPLQSKNTSGTNIENVNVENKNDYKRVVVDHHIKDVVNSKLQEETQQKIAIPYAKIHNETHKKPAVIKEQLPSLGQNDKMLVDQKEKLQHNEIKREPGQAIIAKREANAAETSPVMADKKDAKNGVQSNQNAALETNKQNILLDSEKHEMRRLLYSPSANATSRFS